MGVGSDSSEIDFGRFLTLLEKDFPINPANRVEHEHTLDEVGRKFTKALYLEPILLCMSVELGEFILGPILIEREASKNHFMKDETKREYITSILVTLFEMDLWCDVEDIL